MLRSIISKRCIAATPRCIRLSTFKRLALSLSARTRPLDTVLGYSSATAAFDFDTPIEEPLSFLDNSERFTPPLDISTDDRVKERPHISLRPYQVEAIESCVNALDRGLQRIGVSPPTGSGKTVML
jgi:hypothetical protein